MSKPTTLTAEAYRAKYLTSGATTVNRLFRWLRMARKEVKATRKEAKPT